MKVLIIAAMREELDTYLSRLNNARCDVLYGMQIHSGTIANHNVIIAQSGIGKVGASVFTTLLIEKHNPDLVINSGSAGSANEHLSIGDIVLGKTLSYYDVDVTGFGYQPGQVPQMPEVFQSDSAILKQALATTHHDLTIHSGLICSGDSFINDMKHVNQITHIFKNVLAIDMESTAIAQTCYLLKTPFLIVRAITDYACKKATTTHEENLPLAAQNTSNLVIGLINLLT